MIIYTSMAILYLLLINTFENAYIFSICFIITMLLSDLIISLIKGFVIPSLRVPMSLIITSTIITIIEIIIKKYIPGFYNDMNIYIPLMALIIYDYNSKSLKDSFKNTLTKAFKYVGLLLILVLIKEVVGTNQITLMNNLSNITGYRAVYEIFPTNNLIPISFLLGPGSFILVGLVLGIINKVRSYKHA